MLFNSQIIMRSSYGILSNAVIIILRFRVNPITMHKWQSVFKSRIIETSEIPSHTAQRVPEQLGRAVSRWSVLTQDGSRWSVIGARRRGLAAITDSHCCLPHVGRSMPAMRATRLRAMRAGGACQSFSPVRGRRPTWPAVTNRAERPRRLEEGAFSAGFRHVCRSKETCAL